MAKIRKAVDIAMKNLDNAGKMKDWIVREIKKAYGG